MGDYTKKDNCDLKTKYPEQIREWDYEKNSIAPTEVSYKSVRKVWWKCSRNHSYQEKINIQIKSQGCTCPNCLADMWDERNNGTYEQIYLNNVNDKYWWKCDKGHSFHIKLLKEDVYCPTCKRYALFNELRSEIPNIIEEVVLVNYEKYICSLLEKFDLDNIEGRYDIRLLKGKNSQKKIKHFGININCDEYNKISKDNYIDKSIYDEILGRRKPLINNCYKNPFNNSFYYSIYSDVVAYAKYIEGKSGIVDLSYEFKAMLLSRIYEKSWNPALFFKALKSPFEAEQNVLLEDITNKITDYQHEIDIYTQQPESYDLHYICSLEEYIQERQEYINVLKEEYSFYSNSKKWKELVDDYNRLKTAVLHIKTLKGKVEFFDDLLENDYIKALLEIDESRMLGIKNKHSGLNTLFCGFEKEVIEERERRAYSNFDINMKRFSDISYEDFNNYLMDFVLKNGYEEIFDLNCCKKQSGLYIMVLDEYKQVYIGLAKDLKTRIQQHWGRAQAKPLGKLVFGSMENSVISINSFGPLDTTRIYMRYIPYDSVSEMERDAINEYDSQYLLNRVPGGKVIL